VGRAFDCLDIRNVLLLLEARIYETEWETLPGVRIGRGTVEQLRVDADAKMQNDSD
jgi:hypothetical protein